MILRQPRRARLVKANKKPSNKLYVIRVAGTSYVKIGITGNIKRRLRQLQTGNPFRLEIVYEFVGPPSLVRKYERMVHKELEANGRNLEGEWFLIHDFELEDILVNTGLFTFIRER